MVYLTCRICLGRKSSGDMTVLRTRFARLSDHISREHEGANHRAMCALERNKTCKTKGGRRVFTCRCGQIIQKKRQHLQSKVFHKELVGLSTNTEKFKKAQRQYFKRLTSTDVMERRRVICGGVVGASDDDHEEVDVDEMPIDSEEEASDVETDAVECFLTREYVLGLQKHARVMKVRIVISWSQYLATRLGGEKGVESIKEGQMMINRFLALCGYTEDADIGACLSWHGKMAVYDTYMVKTFTPGTVRSGYCYVTSFVDFLLESIHVISGHVYKEVKIRIGNLSAASKKAHLVRSMARRISEEKSIPAQPNEVLDRFLSSEYVQVVFEEWKNRQRSRQICDQMRSILLLSMASTNGTRCGEFRKLRYAHLTCPRPFLNNKTLTTIILTQHKTATKYTAQIHMNVDVFEILKEYAEATRKALWHGNTSDNLFVFHQIGSDLTLLKDNEEAQPIAHNYINKWFQNGWHKAGMTGHYPGYVPSLTANRKLLTSGVRTMHPEEAANCAHMLCHGEKTADTHYDVRQQIDRSQQTYNRVFSATATLCTVRRKDTMPPPPVFRCQPTSPVSSPPPPPACCMPDDPRVKPCFVDLRDLEMPKDIEVETNMEELKGAMDDFSYIVRQSEEVWDDQDSITPEPIPGCSFWEPKTQKLFFSDAEAAEVAKVFAREISHSAKTNSTIPMHIVKSKRDGLWARFSDKQIREKIRLLVRHKSNYFRV